MRPILTAKMAPPTQAKKPRSFPEVDIFAEWNSPDFEGEDGTTDPGKEASRLPRGGYIRHSQRWNSEKYFPANGRAFKKLQGPPVYPVRRRAFEIGRSRWGSSGVRISFLNAGQPALNCFRFIIAGEVAGDGATLTSFVLVGNRQERGDSCPL